MANNIVYFDTTNNSIQQFNSSDVAKLSDYILEYMAANGTFTGSITVGTSNPIGTFTNTYLGGYPYPAANSDNVTVYSTTYTLSQINTATLTAQSDPSMYVGLDVTDPNTVILQENKTTLANLADEIVDRMIADYGVNSYYLGSTAPADGGVWTNLGALVDTIETTNVTAYLWKKLNSGSYTSNYKRPLKLSSGQLLQFTDTEIQQIVKTIEQRIVATGKGLYSLSTSAPGTGTWTAQGTITDVRRTTQELNFSGSFGGGIFTTDFEGPTFTSDFSGGVFFADFDGPSFVGFVPASFSGTYGGTYSGSQTYTGSTPTNFEGSSFNSSPVTYAGQPFGGVSYSGVSTFPYAGPPLNTSYIGPFPQNFQSPIFTANFTGPAIPYTATYTGTAPANFIGNPISYFSLGYSGPFYSGADGIPYIATYNSIFSASYTGDYIGTYTGDFTATYVGDYTGTRVDSPTTNISTVTLWKRIA